MRRSLILLLGLAVLTASAQAGASESFRLCGPESMGFVRTGKQIVCLGGSLDWRRRARRPASAAQATGGTTAGKPAQDASGGSNKDVDDALNSADIQFRDGDQELGCRWVNNAITAANSNVGGKPSRNQEEQLKAYAKDCNLRY